jgi:mono/diheme cytochrome c family protein
MNTHNFTTTLAVTQTPEAVFDAITNGWGAMPSYAPQIPVQDRWAIIAYVRALQASQNIKTSGPAGSATPTPTPAGGHK